MTTVPSACSGDAILYQDTTFYRRALLTLYHQAYDALSGSSTMPSKEQLDAIAADDYMYRRAILNLSCKGMQLVHAGNPFPETDPIFSAWLAATPPLYVESDPVFSAWLSTYVAPGPETDPVFMSWLATPPNVSIFNNDIGYLTAITLPGVETDPIFNAWLLAPIFRFPLNPIFDIQDSTIIFSKQFWSWGGYNVPTIKSDDGFSSCTLSIDSTTLFCSTISGFDNTNNLALYVANSGGFASPEVDFNVGGARAMVFGYDGNVGRGIFYSDVLAGGMYFWDNTGAGHGYPGLGIALGYDPANYANNLFFVEPTLARSNVNFDIGPGPVNGITLHFKRDQINFGVEYPEISAADAGANPQYVVLKGGVIMKSPDFANPAFLYWSSPTETYQSYLQQDDLTGIQYWYPAGYYVVVAGRVAGSDPQAASDFVTMQSLGSKLITYEDDVVCDAGDPVYDQTA